MRIMIVFGQSTKVVFVRDEDREKMRLRTRELSTGPLLLLSEMVTQAYHAFIDLN